MSEMTRNDHLTFVMKKPKDLDEFRYSYALPSHQNIFEINKRSSIIELEIPEHVMKMMRNLLACSLCVLSCCFHNICWPFFSLLVFGSLLISCSWTSYNQYSIYICELIVYVLSATHWWLRNVLNNRSLIREWSAMIRDRKQQDLLVLLNSFKNYIIKLCVYRINRC